MTASWSLSIPCPVNAAGSYRRGEQIAVSPKRIVRSSAISRRRGKTDWKAVDALGGRAITRAVKSDTDAAPILDKNWFKRATIVMPERKVPISLRIDREVVEWFKACGDRYQSRMNDAWRPNRGDGLKRLAGLYASTSKPARSISSRVRT